MLRRNSVYSSAYHSTETALSLTFTIISSTLSFTKKFPVSVFLTSLQPLIPLTTIFKLLVFHIGLGFMAPFSTGLNLTCHLGLSVLDVINASLPPIPVYVVFPKVLFLVPYFSLCTPLLLVPLSLLCH